MFSRNIQNFTRIFFSINKNLYKPPSLIFHGKLKASFYSTDSFISKIKMPKGPYMLFSSDKMPSMKQMHPELNVIELSKKIGLLWKDLSDEDKEEYRKKYRESKIEYEENIKKLSEQDLSRLQQERVERRKKKNLKKLKQLRKDLEKPKSSGTNAFLLFAKDKMLERGDANLIMYIKGASDFWKKMPEEDKDIYFQRARENSAIYKKKLLEWEKKMISSGNEKVLSPSRLRFHKIGSPVVRKSKKVLAKRKSKPLKGSKKSKKVAKKPSTKILKSKTSSKKSTSSSTQSDKPIKNKT